MRFNKYLLSGVMLSAGALIAIVAGCGSQSSPTTAIPAAIPASTINSPVTSPTAAVTVASNEEKVDEEVHPHKPGSHGGIIIPIGSDSYHAEAVIETTGEFRLLMLGKDETRIQEVDVQPVKAYVKVRGAHQGHLLMVDFD